MKVDAFSLVVTIITTAFSTWLTVYLYFHSIAKDLRFLITKDRTELNYSQAISLAELYVFHIQTVIRAEVERYIETHFRDNISPQHIPITEEFINRITDNTISVAKDKFEKFRLFGGESFSDLISELLREKAAVTRKTKLKAKLLFEKCAKDGICGEPLKALFINLIKESGDQSKVRIINKLKNLYNYKHG